MPTIRLTQRAVDVLKAPKAGRVEYFDSICPGFGLRVSKHGSKTWIAMYRVNGKLVRETIGSLAVIPKVDVARDRARESLQKARAGTNPVTERRERARAESDKLPDTFAAVADLYVERYAKKNTKETTWKEVRRKLDVDVLPKWGARPIGTLTRRDMVELLDGIADRGSPVQANRTLTRMRTLFNWAVEREIIPASPIAKMKLPTVEKPRDRVLDDDEIRLFWGACGKLDWPFGPLFKLLLLTAQRRDEVAGLEWAEIDLEKRLWTLPRERAKNDRAHEVQLSTAAVSIIEGLSRVHDRLVFTTNGESHVSGWGKAKVRLDKAMVAHDPQTTIAPFILHDLRRTAATGMARLNIAPHVVDKILNHLSGTIRGVAAVYNRFEYLDERRAALEAWGRYVENLVHPAGDKNVVQFAGSR
jgi:integrase